MADDSVVMVGMATPTGELYPGCQTESFQNPVGRALTLSFSGTSWSALQASDPNVAFGLGLYAIWASPDGGLVLAAGTNTIARQKGNDWSKESIPIVSLFKDIWGTSAASVYAVGGDFNSNTMTTSNALAYVSDGTSWSAITFNLPELADKGWRLEAVWARSASEVYVAGGVWQLKNNTWDTRWLLMVYDGTAWKILPPPSGANIEREIMALRGDDQHLYVSDWQNIWVYDGSTWTIECSGKMTFGFAFGANGEVLGYGPDGLFLRP